MSHTHTLRTATSSTTLTTNTTGVSSLGWPLKGGAVPSLTAVQRSSLLVTFEPVQVRVRVGEGGGWLDVSVCDTHSAQRREARALQEVSDQRKTNVTVCVVLACLRVMMTRARSVSPRCCCAQWLKSDNVSLWYVHLSPHTAHSRCVQVESDLAQLRETLATFDPPANHPINKGACAWLVCMCASALLPCMH
jgi:hypothetical protein